MASLEELERTLPTYFTLSNKNLIITAHVRDETVFFYDLLEGGQTTTIFLLSEPQNFGLKKIFLDFMNNLGVEVIDIREPEIINNPNYKMCTRSKQILDSLLKNESFEKIIIHPRYAKENDPQNRALHDFVTDRAQRYGLNNIYTYNKIGINGTPRIPCGIKKGILELYTRVQDPKKKLNKKIYNNYASITSNIRGVRLLQNK